MSADRHFEATLETFIEANVLENGYAPVARDGFDRDRAIFPETVRAFIRETQPTEWAKLEALRGDKAGEEILGDLCKRMDQKGSLATLRHGFTCFLPTHDAAFMGTCANRFEARRNLRHARPEGRQ